MGTHKTLFPLLVSAIRGEKVTPFNPGGGSPNYKLMFAFTAWITDPSSVNLNRCLGLLQNMKANGHLTLRGPGGVACEQGSPAAHWSFSIGSVVGGLLWALRRKCQPLIDACLSFLEDEVGLDLDFRWGGVTALPCPRVVGGDDDSRDLEEAPIDGYRNTFVALAIGDKVKKGNDYWTQPNAIAVSTMREVMQAHPEFVERFKRAKRPHLYLPIDKGEAVGGGYVAVIEKTPEAVAVMGRDCCHAVRNGPSGVEYQIDWKDEWLRPGRASIK